MQKSPYTIQQYLNIRSAYFPSFSPKGDRIAFLTDITGTPQVWQVQIDPHGQRVLWPDQLTFGDDRVAGLAYSPVDEDTLLFARDTGGNENMQLYLLSLERGSVSPLTEGYENAMHMAGGWAPDGRSFLFAANRRHPGLFDVYVQPLDGDARLVWENPLPGFPFMMIFSPDGSRALVNRMVSSYHNDLIEIDLVSGKQRLLSPTGEDVVYAWVSYGADGRSILVSTDLGSDFLHLARLDPDTQKLSPLLRIEADVDIALLSPDRRKLAYAINRDGTSELHLLDLDSRLDLQVPETGNGPGVMEGLYGAGGISFSPDSTRLVYTFSGAGALADIWLWDWLENRIHPVTRSSTAGIHRRSFTTPELVSFPTFDTDPNTGQTRQIPAWLYRPQHSEGRLASVILVHGGPEGQYRPEFEPVAQYLLQQGYAVLATNVRGSTGFGKAYSHLDDVEKRMDSVNDLAHAAFWLKSRPEFDGDRIAVMGASYGGFMVLASLTTYPDLWAAGVDIVGISNFVTFLENTSEYRRAHRAAEYGTLEHDREFLERISPSNHLDKIRAPLMVIHGANDPRVPLSETLQLVKKLEERGVPVEKLIFDDEGHGLVKLKNKLAAYPAVAEFLDKHV